MAKPPSYPPPPPRFASSMATNEEGNASAEATASILVSAGTSSAMGCDFLASRGGQTTLDVAWNKDKFKEADFWYCFDIPFNVARSPY